MNLVVIFISGDLKDLAQSPTNISNITTLSSTSLQWKHNLVAIFLSFNPNFRIFLISVIISQSSDRWQSLRPCLDVKMRRLSLNLYRQIENRCNKIEISALTQHILVTTCGTSYTKLGYNLLQRSMLYDKTSLVKDLNSAIESHQFETHFFTWVLRRLLSR